MKNQYARKHIFFMKGMVWAGTIGATLALLLRVVLMPTLRDSDTGRFDTSWVVVTFMLLMVALLALPAVKLSMSPPPVMGRGAIPLSLASMGAGVALLLPSLWDAWNWLATGEQPAPYIDINNIMGGITLLGALLFGIIGGVSLIRLGLQISSEGGARRGMASWEALAPVLWMWFRLARYEMSYASAVGLSEIFYDFMLFIFSLLFLFRFARFTAGVGAPTMGGLLFFSTTTAMFSLSGPLTRLCMYLLGDSEAYHASQLAGWPDLGIGVLALTFAYTLVNSALSQSSSVSASDVEADSQQ